MYFIKKSWKKKSSLDVFYQKNFIFLKNSFLEQ